MADLRTNYQDDVLDASKNTARVYDLVDSNGTVVLAGVHLEDKTVYTTKGGDYGATDINTQNGKINEVSNDLSELKETPDLLYTVISNVTGATLTHSINDYRNIRFIICSTNESRVYNAFDIQTPLLLSSMNSINANTTLNSSWNTRRIDFVSATTINVSASSSVDDIHVLIYGIK